MKKYIKKIEGAGSYIGELIGNVFYTEFVPKWFKEPFDFDEYTKHKKIDKILTPLLLTSFKAPGFIIAHLGHTQDNKILEFLGGYLFADFAYQTIIGSWDIFKKKRLRATLASDLLTFPFKGMNKSYKKKHQYI